MKRFRADFASVDQPALVVAGGVAANQTIAPDIAVALRRARLPLHRAAALALHRQRRDDRLAGAERLAAGLPADGLDAAPRSRWPARFRSQGIESAPADAAPRHDGRKDERQIEERAKNRGRRGGRLRNGAFGRRGQRRTRRMSLCLPGGKKRPRSVAYRAE